MVDEDDWIQVSRRRTANIINPHLPFFNVQAFKLQRTIVQVQASTLKPQTSNFKVNRG
jgi:hypothetical protein